MSENTFNAYNPAENEEKIRTFWKESEILDSINSRNTSGEKFYFLQGPPYTSGKLHSGQGWNHALKDAVLRFKRMNGFDVLARAGYDMHGLPTELKVQSKLELKDKEDIEAFGYEKFVDECILWSEEKSEAMNKDLINMGITLDYSDPYKPISQDYIDSIWYLIKQADAKKRLYLGERTMLWCPVTESALAKHEVEYKEIKDESIFLKFKKEGTENEYFIIWTTTPWTIPFNLAIMVNPEMEYVDCSVTHNGKNEVWTICKDLAGIFLGNLDECTYEIGTPYLGKELEGKKYIHPWAKENPDIEEMKLLYPKLFTVLLSSEYVDSSAGTGLVHCAPGCGPEDYEVGRRNGLPPYNTIDEKGVFPDKTKKYAGLIAKTDDKKFIKLMKEDEFLVTSSSFEHEYPFSERAKVPVIFRTTKQWFFKVEDLKEKMLAINKETYWHPETAKNAFTSWLDNLRDNSITKQRIWGTPAPIWIHRDKEGNIDEYYVVGSRDELEQLVQKEGNKLPENLHKPWIDSITFKSPNTGNTLIRIPDVLDVWIDAGCASWASLYYPKRKDLFEKYFPADFIIEGKDQIRGWFNLLMVAGILGLDAQVFKNVSMHGFITGVDGVKMSKSLGNIITPEEIIQKTSVDAFRYYFSQNEAGKDIAFSWDQALLHQRHLTILWNTAKYFVDQMEAQEDLTFEEVLAIGEKHFTEMEKYIFSKTQSTIQHVTHLFNEYKIDEVPEPIAELFIAISRNYIQAIRDKMSGTKEERATVLYTLYKTLSQTITLFAPICPFITEMIYQNFKHISKEPELSIHEKKWPVVQEKYIDPKIEKEVEVSFSIITGILASREIAQQNVRQPLAKAIVITNNKEILSAGLQLQELIKNQTNIKEIDVVENFDKLEYSIKPNYKQLGVDFGTETATIGQAIQQLDKNAAKLIYQTLQKEKTYDFKGKNISAQHVSFEISVEKPYVSSEIPGAIIAIDSSLSEELLAEGFAREFTRRVQQERKNMKLVKKDRILITIDSKEVLDKIEQYISEIQETCGITNITYSKEITGTAQSIKSTTFTMDIKRG